MIFSFAIIMYVITLILCFAVPTVTALLIKKKNESFRLLSFLCGMVYFIISTVLVGLLLALHLSSRDEISNYNITTGYKIVVIGLALALLMALFQFILHAGYIRKSKQGALSFAQGIGSSAPILLGTYSLLMVLILVVQYFSSNLQGFDQAAGCFLFENNVFIAVFQPMSGHVSIAVILLSVFGMFVCSAFTALRAAAMEIKIWKRIICIVVQMLSLICSLETFIFMKQFSLEHWQSAVISVAMLTISVIILYILPRLTKKEKVYEHQFD